MDNTVYENIGKLILLRDFTQAELAYKSKLSRNTINQISSVKRKSNPKLSTLIKVSKALDVDFPQLFICDINVEKSFGEERALKEYLNIFIQNIEFKIRGSNQKLLSSEPGIQESTVSELLNGNISDPNLSTLYAISTQLDIGLDFLFTRGGDLT